MVHYSRGQVKSILDNIGVEIVASTEKRFNCLCPFHDNRNSPAFSISKSEGLWICFNEDCGEKGNLEQLVMKTTGRSEMETARFIAAREVEEDSLSDILDGMFAPEPEWPVFPEQVVQQLHTNYLEEGSAQEYMAGRGFDDKTMKFFQVGYSPKRGGQVVYPVHTPDGKLCVGVVGRGISSKFFDNSKNMPKNRILFNLHNARRHSKAVVVVESGFDAMRLHQAGFPNSVATLGSYVSKEQVELMERNFTDIILFSDNDDAGIGMRQKIMSHANSASVLHAAWDYDTLYPSEGINPGAPKDVGDLHIEQIRHMVNNSLTSYDVGLP